MSDWFENQNMNDTPSTEPTPTEPTPTPTEDTPAVPETPAPPTPPTPTAWSSGWSSPITPPTPPTMPTGEPTQPTMPPMPPTPPNPTPEATPPTPPTPPTQNGWQSPNGGYRPPQTPYSWNPPPTPPKKKKNWAGVLIALLAVVCVGCFVGSIFLMGDQGGDPDDGRKPSVGDKVDKDNDKDDNSDAPSIITVEPEEEGLSSSEIVSANLDSTVIIKMYASMSIGSFFAPTTEEEAQAGEATGIVWTADGYIITNAHCVFSEELNREFDRIEVELYNGTVYENAQIIGYDTTTDLAVIKVDASDLTPATFGDSDALKLGDRVLALGNNSGLGWTVTGGMVSGLARDVYEETNYAIKCLQVDAVINPGNSGGPLLNSSGQVVAINSAKIVAEGYEGLGFSIPINEAKSILSDLVDHGYVKGRIMLGIEGYTFNRYSGYEGFYISAIGEKSSFAGTNARVGDIITHVNGVRVESYAEMREQLTSYAVGDTVEITLIRINRNSRTVETIKVDVVLMESDGSV